MLRSLLSLIGALGAVAGSSSLGTYLTSRGTSAARAAEVSEISPVFTSREEAISAPEVTEATNEEVPTTPNLEVAVSEAAESKEPIYLSPRNLHWSFTKEGYSPRTDYVMAADEFAANAGMGFRSLFLEVSGLSGHRDHTADIMESACKKLSRYTVVDPAVTESLKYTVKNFCYQKVGHKLV